MTGLFNWKRAISTPTAPTFLDRPFRYSTYRNTSGRPPSTRHAKFG